jgi:hypothetical protein
MFILFLPPQTIAKSLKHGALAFKFNCFSQIVIDALRHDRRPLKLIDDHSSYSCFPGEAILPNVISFVKIPASSD